MVKLKLTPEQSLFRRSLPVFITPENKNMIGILLASLGFLLYVPSNHFHFFIPKHLTFSWIDTAVPFIPHTVWLYTSEYVYFVVVYLTCKDLKNLNKYFYSFLVLQSVSVIIFMVWPTTYPRELFPLPSTLDPLTYLLFNTLRIADTPANCCPSLHVSSVYLSSFIFLDDQRKKFPLFFLWGTGIAFSTLTTKQHYMIDVLTGFVMAVAAYWIFHRCVSYHVVTKPKSAVSDEASPLSA